MSHVYAPRFATLAPVKTLGQEGGRAYTQDLTFYLTSMPPLLVPHLDIGVETLYYRPIEAGSTGLPSLLLSSKNVTTGRQEGICVVHYGICDRRIIHHSCDVTWHNVFLEVLCHQKGRTGEGGWCTHKVASSMAASGLSCRKPLFGTGWAISLLLYLYKWA